MCPNENTSIFSVRFISPLASSGDRHCGLGYFVGIPHAELDVVFQRRRTPMLKSFNLSVPPMLTYRKKREWG